LILYNIFLVVIKTGSIDEEEELSPESRSKIRQKFKKVINRTQAARQI
jgi:hypothetical protein